MVHPNPERLQAYFDGELDATAAAEVERHSETCAQCQAELDSFSATQKSVRENLTYHRADPGLRRRVLAALPAGTRERPQLSSFFARVGEFWRGAIGGALATGLAASLALFTMLPSVTDPLTIDIANAHVRSLMSDHLIDVASSDHHTVKPWFATHADVSPPVKDLGSRGFALVGGRTDYVDGHRASVVVYRHGAHVINVFAWAAQGANSAKTVSRSGYRLVFWRNGDLDFCAVSDAAPAEVETLVALIKSPG